MKKFERNSFLISANIRLYRQKKHMTVAELAAAVDKNTNHINMIELGTRNPSTDLLFDIMNVLEVDANTLFGITSVQPELHIEEQLAAIEPRKQKFLINSIQYMIQQISDRR